jgi:hypothetical protein
MSGAHACVLSVPRVALVLWGRSHGVGVYLGLSGDSFRIESIPCSLPVLARVGLRSGSQDPVCTARPPLGKMHWGFLEGKVWWCLCLPK